MSLREWVLVKTLLTNGYDWTSPMNPSEWALTNESYES